MVSYPQALMLSETSGSVPSRMSLAVSSHWPLVSSTWSPTLTWRTPSPTAQTTPEASEPPMWKSSGWPWRCRIPMTSTGLPSEDHTLL